MPSNSLPIRSLRTALRKGEGLFHVLADKLPQPPITLAGDRSVEWSWVAGQMPNGPGRALDFGPGSSWLSLIAAHRGYDVVAVDLRRPGWFFQEPRIEFLQGDILDLSFQSRSFDLVINCSSIEHVGLVGRYGVTQARPDGDLEAMREMRRLTRPGGLMLLTIPVGRDAVFAPLHRVYGEERLPRLLEGWRIEKEEYWGKDGDNRWVRAERAAALGRVPRRDLYALGCFALRPADGPGR
ncbi:MAG: DUF268 domain-containing protein [Chloroflexi bacterium]|nr:DUF268 domain-containing protein [Chloroflexota bacterium]